MTGSVVFEFTVFFMEHHFSLKQTTSLLTLGHLMGFFFFFFFFEKMNEIISPPI